jgi:DNA-binding NtrC family response regulator
MKRILFVDDEPLVLEALRRMLRGMRQEWEMEFVTGGAAALQAMAAHPADVIVSDMRMANMNGAELLNEIMRLYPKTIRFILSGYADTEMIMQCVGGTHQFLSKPCDGETLRSLIRRTVAMDPWMNDDRVKPWSPA